MQRLLTGLLLLLLLLLLPGRSAADPGLAVDDPTLLQALEADGFGLQALAFAGSAPRYRALVDHLAASLQAARRADPLLDTSLRTAHRLFDVRWLTSPAARFELVGVVNRLDRAPFGPGCGETRFIYRLAYRTDAAASRLPMTVNVVFLEPAGAQCLPAAQRWQRFVAGLPLGAVGWRGAGFVPAAFPPARLQSIEVNLQSVRWPSTVRPDMAGYAEYLLRVFVPHGDTLVAAPLENTPDVARLRADPAARRRLQEWIRANFAVIDAGTAQVPEEFLASAATSVALHGVHRLANLPFSQLFTEGDFAGLPYATGTHVRSAHGLLRRLDDSSCTGCHQGRTVAGFHFLGLDRAGTDAVNAIAVPSSAHFRMDQPRRRRHLDALLAGAPLDLARPLSVRAAEDPGDLGAHCGLGDPTFAAWTCRAGLRCAAVVRDDRLSRTGVCVADAPAAGAPCIHASAVHHAHPHRDRLRRTAAGACSGSDVCEASSVGFPSGMCARGGCSDVGPGETCGAIAVLAGFNACLAQRRPFATCLAANVRPAVLQACGDALPACRDDYICSRTATGAGACTPPYFLFQLRLDGHGTPP